MRAIHHVGQGNVHVKREIEELGDLYFPGNMSHVMMLYWISNSNQKYCLGSCEREGSTVRYLMTCDIFRCKDGVHCRMSRSFLVGACSLSLKSEWEELLVWIGNMSHVISFVCWQ